jgi:hypothetical protein
MKFHPEILAVFSSGRLAAWIYCGLAVCLMTGCVVMVRRRNKTQRRRIRAPVPPPAIKKRGRVNSASSKPLPVAVKNSAPNGHAWPKPEAFRRKRRKRVFNYSKFYTSVMRELSLHSYHPANMANGKFHANGHNHVPSNGQANGHAVSNGTEVNQTIKSEIENLIAGQQVLIQKQKMLLEQQARLIEEKTRIIEEQTALKTKRAAQAACDNANVNP